MPSMWKTWARAALTLALCLTLLGLPAPAPAEEAPRGAFLLSPNDQAVALCNTSDDYEFPAAVYFDGVRVTVDQVGKGVGGYPGGISDPEELWAHVTIVAEDGATLLSGWTVNAALQYDGETARSAPPLPEGRFVSEAELYLDNGLSDQVLGSYPEGTAAQLLGLARDWGQVRVEGRTGFVKAGSLGFNEETQRRVDAAQPAYGFEEIPLGHRERYLAYMEKRDALMGGQPREAAELDLRTRAQISALAEEYGFVYLDFINDLPGPEDLSEAEAQAKGWAALQAHFRTDRSRVSRLDTFFYHWPDKPDTRLWRVTAQGRDGWPTLSVELDTQGEPVGYDQADGMPPPQLSPEAGRLARGSILYFVSYYEQSEPPAGVISREAAIELAWQRFLETVPGSEPEAFELTGATYHDWPAEQVSWWLVSIMEKDGAFDAPVWNAAVLAPDGSHIVSSEGERYAADIAQARIWREQEALAQARGPFEMWSKEEKAEAYPQFYRLPEAGDLDEAKAIELARAAIQKHLYADDKTLDSLKLVTALTTEAVWRVEYYEWEPVDGQAVCRYAAAINARSGEVIEVVADAPIGNG